MSDAPDLSGLIKAYDIRGIVGESLNDDVARAIGAAFADAVVLPDGDTHVVIGHDMRDSGPSLMEAVGWGLRRRGVNVVEIGLCSTDGLYHASGILELPGVMITASHNPAGYNGMKMCRPLARAVGETTGLGRVRELTADTLARQASGTGDIADAIAAADVPGEVSERETLAEYAAFLRDLVDLSDVRPLTVVVDAGNAMAGLTVPAVLGGEAGLDPLPLTIIPLYFELDGTFPNHEANPLDPANLVDLQRAVREHGADLGLAFDGDADRCFAVDERGEVVPASAITALVGLREAAREAAAGRSATVIHNLISSRAVPEQLAAAGVTPVRSRVGHSIIKAQMAELDAIFGGEHSAHFYFRDFFFADSGMLAAMHLMAALGGHDGTLSDLLERHSPYAASGEINSTVIDAAAARERVRAAFAGPDVTEDNLDGMTLEHWATEPRWWLNVRASNTEPLLRLNVEAADPAVMADIRDRALELIREA
ncbi:phosphomannomutase/phosphoglucomutase [Demequina sediminicola]|uniref:phosphomannomutase/phosphoglucomutase n=1 Tax=Demequina sediminicola TaxID=1095026 RepID=UPI000A8186DC|nr:phosphomannomutase/phosphoglucomutase [Demequina sediminicola]